MSTRSYIITRIIKKIKRDSSGTFNLLNFVTNMILENFAYILGQKKKVTVQLQISILLLLLAYINSNLIIHLSIALVTTIENKMVVVQFIHNKRQDIFERQFARLFCTIYRVVQEEVKIVRPEGEIE